MGLATNLTAEPLSASFTASPTNGLAPLAVTFTDTSTGAITNRFWDFGDGGTTNTTTNAVTYTYAPGTYTVTLVVTGPNGVSTNTQPNYVAALTAFQSWQVQYFGSTTNAAAAANVDSDGNGFSNWQKYLAGIDPTNSSLSFRIISVVPSGIDCLVTWMMGSGRTNALQATAGNACGGYTTNNFADIFTVTNTLGTMTNYLDAAAATNVPARYYRVRLVP